MNEDRLIIEVEIYCDYDAFDILHNKSFDEVIALMEDFKREYANRDVYFVCESYGHNGEFDTALYERRLENDQEYADRLKREETTRQTNLAKQKKKEQQELAELKRLKKKYEKT